ncbi:MAG: hypothetical protein CVU22_13880 [Betaproteobacteria bacterium HGW-Betaproteobacteria-16]|nr:MAG: hypothetical protein CVU22_13880 [Betaproteobacteria bacterium HGW-Betaproteobacteria-16]
MTRPHQRLGRKSEQSRFRAGESLGEQRYQELMRGLSDLFQQENQQAVPHPTAARRAEVIEEINALMSRYGLTVEDIDDL